MFDMDIWIIAVLLWVYWLLMLICDGFWFVECCFLVACCV